MLYRLIEIKYFPTNENETSINVQSQSSDDRTTNSDWPVETPIHTEPNCRPSSVGNIDFNASSTVTFPKTNFHRKSNSLSSLLVAVVRRFFCARLSVYRSVYDLDKENRVFVLERARQELIRHAPLVIVPSNKSKACFADFHDS